MTIIRQLQYTTAESKQYYNATMGENTESTTITTDNQKQTPFDSHVNESKTREDNRIEKVRGKIESYIQTQLVYIQNYYKSPEFTEKYKSMLRELANSSPDDDNIWTPKQKNSKESYSN